MNILLIYITFLTLILIFQIWLISDILKSKIPAWAKGLWVLALFSVPFSSIIWLLVRKSANKKKMARVRSYKKNKRSKR